MFLLFLLSKNSSFINYNFNIFAEKDIALKDYFENPGIRQPSKLVEGKVSWESPSNIAFVKYWGKYGNQLPKNASLSMSLSNSVTNTSIEYKSSNDSPKREFFFNGKLNDHFSKRIWKYIQSLYPIYPFLEKMDLSIESKNSFPHSAGIASSASAMSALALCLVDLERHIFNNLNDDEFYNKASYIARLGSGSASRSVYGGFTIWGQAKLAHSKTDNKFAIDYNSNIHEHFQDLQDAIMIVDEGQKEVSSSMGHSLMDNHPYSDDRIAQADKHLNDLSEALVKGDKKTFIRIVENEALSLHALMMSSEPWFILMKPQTLSIIEKIKAYRKKTDAFIAFTLDAGPNVHVIYSKQDEGEINLFIEKELKPLCYQFHVIYDEMGKGPKKIK